MNNSTSAMPSYIPFASSDLYDSPIQTSHLNWTGLNYSHFCVKARLWTERLVYKEVVIQAPVGQALAGKVGKCRLAARNSSPAPGRATDKGFPYKIDVGDASLVKLSESNR